MILPECRSPGKKGRPKNSFLREQLRRAQEARPLPGANAPERETVIGMSLLKVEQETIILFNEAEATASVYTHNAALQRVLLELCQTHPAQVQQTEDNRHGGLTFELPKKWVKITPPRALSEAQKRVLDEMNQRNRERRQST